MQVIILIVLMSTMNSQLLALLTFLLMLLLSGVQALVTQFSNTTIPAALFGTLLLYDLPFRFVL